MIAPEIVADVRRLLAEGTHSQRKIARLTGISRGTVGAIASGRRPDYNNFDNGNLEEPSGPPKRCPGCGGKVYMPCLLCRARKESAENPRGSARGSVVAPVRVSLELRPEHHARYRQVCDWRRRNHGQPFRGCPAA